MEVVFPTLTVLSLDRTSKHESFLFDYSMAMYLDRGFCSNAVLTLRLLRMLYEVFRSREKEVSMYPNCNRTIASSLTSLSCIAI